MEIQHCTGDDFYYIVTHLAEFWGSERTRRLHHPMFVYEFGSTAYVILEGNQVVAHMAKIQSPRTTVDRASIE